MKRKIRLTESDLHRIVKESVKKVIIEAAMPQQMDDESIIQMLFNDEEVYNAIVQSCGGYIKTDNEEFEFDQDDFIMEVIDYFVRDEDAESKEDILELLSDEYYDAKHMKDWNWNWLERKAEERIDYLDRHYGY